jgi:hypothetical protein
MAAATVALMRLLPARVVQVVVEHREQRHQQVLHEALEHTLLFTGTSVVPQRLQTITVLAAAAVLAVLV